MTIRASLARYVRGLLADPPTPSPSSTRPTTTTSTSPNGISEAAVYQAMMEQMMKMHLEQIKEMRELVLSILQGRPMSETPSTTSSARPSTAPFDPPDYDNPGTEDLPPGIQSIFAREDQEQVDLRHLRTEREVLDAQLEEARAAIMDPQGPAFENS
jgi:hypothetical protein